MRTVPLTTPVPVFCLTHGFTDAIEFIQTSTYKCKCGCVINQSAGYKDEEHGKTEYFLNTKDQKAILNATR